MDGILDGMERAAGPEPGRTALWLPAPPSGGASLHVDHVQDMDADTLNAPPRGEPLSKEGLGSDALGGAAPAAEEGREDALPEAAVQLEAGDAFSAASGQPAAAAAVGTRQADELSPAGVASPIAATANNTQQGAGLKTSLEEAPSAPAPQAAPASGPVKREHVSAVPAAMSPPGAPQLEEPLPPAAAAGGLEHDIEMLEAGSPPRLAIGHTHQGAGQHPSQAEEPGKAANGVDWHAGQEGEDSPARQRPLCFSRHRHHRRPEYQARAGGAAGREGAGQGAGCFASHGAGHGACRGSSRGASQGAGQAAVQPAVQAICLRADRHTAGTGQHVRQQGASRPQWCVACHACLPPQHRGAPTGAATSVRELRRRAASPAASVRQHRRRAAPAAAAAAAVRQFRR